MRKVTTSQKIVSFGQPEIKTTAGSKRQKSHFFLTIDISGLIWYYFCDGSFCYLSNSASFAVTTDNARQNNRMPDVPYRVIELVETFGCNIEAYCSQQYNEAQLRREFSVKLTPPINKSTNSSMTSTA